MLESIKGGTAVDPVLLKRRVRKGIPDSMRGLAWPILSKSEDVIPAEFEASGNAAWMRSLLCRKLERQDL